MFINKLYHTDYGKLSVDSRTLTLVIVWYSLSMYYHWLLTKEVIHGITATKHLPLPLYHAWESFCLLSAEYTTHASAKKESAPVIKICNHQELFKMKAWKPEVANQEGLIQKLKHHHLSTNAGSIGLKWKVHTICWNANWEIKGNKWQLKWQQSHEDTIDGPRRHVAAVSRLENRASPTPGQLNSTPHIWGGDQAANVPRMENRAWGSAQNLKPKRPPA